MISMTQPTQSESFIAIMVYHHTLCYPSYTIMVHQRILFLPTECYHDASWNPPTLFGTHRRRLRSTGSISLSLVGKFWTLVGWMKLAFQDKTAAGSGKDLFVLNYQLFECELFHIVIVF